MLKKRKYSKELVSDIVKKSYSVSDVMRTLNLIPRGANYSVMNKLIKIDYALDTSHFNKSKSITYKTHFVAKTKEQFIEEVLRVNGTGWHSIHIKAKILEFELLINQCSICGIKPIWNGKKLVLHLHHINGDSKDNRLDNLEFLCPNCHSQTETYCNGGKSKK